VVGARFGGPWRSFFTDKSRKSSRHETMELEMEKVKSKAVLVDSMEQERTSPTTEKVDLDTITPTMSPDALLELVDPKSVENLKKMGGVAGLVATLNSHMTNGLPATDELLESIRNNFGSNKLPDPISKTFLQFVWEAFHDKTLIVLMFAAFAEIAIGVYKVRFIAEKDREEAALIDGFAILAAGIVP
jgi:magnesium-transporting ATPase (P-type)